MQREAPAHFAHDHADAYLVALDAVGDAREREHVIPMGACSEVWF